MESEPLSFIVYEPGAGNRPGMFYGEGGRWVRSMSHAQSFDTHQGAEKLRVKLLLYTGFVFAVMPTL